MHGAAVGAVVARGAGHGDGGTDDSGDLEYGFGLVFRQGLEISHVAGVVQHLLGGGHAGEHGHDVVVRGGKAYGPGGDRGLAVEGVQKRFGLGGDACKRAAAHGFHDDDGLAVLGGDFVAAAGLDGNVLPV